MPGFVDTHRHTWQTTMRAICADWTLMDYFRGIRLTISPRYLAEDVYAGNYVGALEALDAGVTTILDFSHCNNTPRARRRGARGPARRRHPRGLRLRLLPRARATRPGFPTTQARIADARRIQAEHLSSRRRRW